MKQLAWVQICTWLGLFCMWLYFPVAVARNVFGAPNETSPLYTEGVEWAGICFAMYSVVCFLFAGPLPGLAARLGRKTTHSLCLLCGACGLLSVAVIHDKWLLLLSMTGVGIAWASTLSMPYAILSGCLPANRVGIYMGVFNFSIVLPEIVASLGFGWLMSHVLDNNRLAAVVAGSVFLLLAAVLMQRVKDREPAPAALKAVPATTMSKVVLFLGFAAALGAAPVITKVDPPYWWVRHSINPVRLLIRGTGLAGASVKTTTKGVEVGESHTNSGGTYLFVDVTIKAPGPHPLKITTADGSATAAFEALNPLPHEQRFQGFSEEDLIYLIMPDRFANGDRANDDPAASKGLFRPRQSSLLSRRRSARRHRSLSVLEGSRRHRDLAQPGL